jgi:hypothetical protein
VAKLRALQPARIVAFANILLPTRRYGVACGVDDDEDPPPLLTYWDLPLDVLCIHSHLTSIQLGCGGAFAQGSWHQLAQLPQLRRLSLYDCSSLTDLPGLRR